jgi:hypothetical protein
MTVKLARTATVGILMPATALYKHNKLQQLETYEEIEQVVNDVRGLYEGVYHRTDDFDAKFIEMSIADSSR